MKLGLIELETGSGKIHSIIDNMNGFDSASKAFERIGPKKTRGKMVIKVRE